LHCPRIVTFRRTVRRANRWLLGLLAAACIVTVPGCESVFLGPPQYASVSVEAMDSSGIGIPDVFLLLYTGVRIIAYGRTDAVGRYLFVDVPPGEYGVQLAIPASFPLSFRDETDPPYLVVDNLTVASGTIQPVRFTLRPCRGVIDVTVTDLVGATAAGVNLNFYTFAGVVQQLQTSAGGTRSLGVSCGQYGVAFVPTLGYVSPAGRNSSYADGLVVHRDSRVSAALKVQSCFGSLRVSVLDAANAPVSAASLIAYTSTVVLATGLTGADGRFTVARVPCGTDIGVVVDAPARYRVVAGRGTSFVDGLRMANGVVTDVTFRLAAP
jgi:hypothetical protein